MHRPGVIARTLALVFALTVCTAEAQTPIPRIGLLGPDEEPRFSDIAAGLKQGLLEHGYRDDSIHVVESRTPRGDDAGARAAVRALLEQRVTVLFVVGSTLARIARGAASQLPIVFMTPGDPVAAGLVASLSRPGRNMTALTFEYPELAGKRLELLREMSRQVRRVLALYDARDESPRQGAAAARAAAAALGITLVTREVRNGDEVRRALTALDEVDALLGIPGGVLSAHYAEMIRAANAKRLPTIVHARTPSTRDALLTYGVSDVEVARQAARVLNKIVQGANAGELPVERPTRLTLVVNLKTASAIKLTVPRTLLLQANEIIE